LDASFLTFLQKNPMNMVFFGTAVVTGGMLLQPLFTRLFSGSTAQVGALEAVQLINRRDALVLDVRDKKDFAAGHVPNARNIPFAELDERLREIEKFKSRPVIVTCQAGARSDRPAAGLQSAVLAKYLRCVMVSAGGRKRAFRLRSRNKWPAVTMYSTGMCPYCVMAERLLVSRGVKDIHKIRVDLEPVKRTEMMERHRAPHGAADLHRRHARWRL